MTKNDRRDAFAVSPYKTPVFLYISPSVGDAEDLWKAFFKLDGFTYKNKSGRPLINYKIPQKHSLS